MSHERRNEKVSRLKTGGCNGRKEKGNLSQQSGGKGTLRMGDTGLFVCLEESSRKRN